MKWIDQAGFAARVGLESAATASPWRWAASGFVAPVRIGDRGDGTPPNWSTTGTTSMHFAIGVSAQDPQEAGKPAAVVLRIASSCSWRSTRWTEADARAAVDATG
jgi:hypothetical protein